MALPMASIPNLMLQGAERSKLDAPRIVSTWLSDLQDVVESNDISRLGQLFLDDSWWRDIISLSWSIQSSHGQNLSKCIQLAHQVGLTELKPVTTGALVPQIVDMGPFTLIESAFTFETRIGRGRGHLRLGNTAPDEWKAWIIMTNVQEIKGHEELHKMSMGPHWPSPQDDAKYDAVSQKNPRVLWIIGAGHSGLALSARLKQLGVPALIVDKLPRVGDSWRLRYMNLNLHDPRWENHMPYLRFPDTFPAWIPRKQIADWLEHYRSILQLPVKLGSTVTSTKWDGEAKLWTIEIEKDDSKTYFNPAHVVLATGFHSDVANIPDFEGLQDFKGPILHSTQYSTASDIQDYKSKKFVVIGSSSSANDVAQDLATTGVDVTMVQRDANCVYSMNSKVNVVGASFMKPGISTEDGDILVSSMPFPVAITLMVGGTQMIYQMDKELLDRVGKTGFKFLKGDDGRGLLHLLFKKGGGHYPDQGSLELIANGTVKVKQCDNGIQRLTSSGVVLADGREIEADAIVLATGYKHADHALRRIFGDELADQCTIGMRFDDHNEINGLYTSIHPGLWWIAGSFSMNRPNSLNLALQIKAVEVGLNPDHYRNKA